MKKQSLSFLLIFNLLSIICVAQNYPVLVQVKGGTFAMGDELTTGDSIERPVHLVKINTFSIAKTETTVLQWKQYCQETGQSMPNSPKKWSWIDSHPIRNITWTEATNYCKWLSKKTGKQYRLPTEAEWEYAARGGRLRKSFDRIVNETTWHKNNSDTTSHPVAEKKPNPLGLYDMTGNVWEWCQDWFGKYPMENQVNPTGMPMGDDKITRGGGWFTDEAKNGFSIRGHHPPEYQSVIIGFRVVSR